MTEQPADRGSGGDLDAIGTLAEPNRRALYDYVADQRDWVSREQAADALGLRRGISAHHLDRLADEGLLEVTQRHLGERRGPGAGRPAKVYRRAPTELSVALPPRRYDLAGEVLAEAIDRARDEGTPVDRAVDDAAFDAGRRIGAETRRALGRRTGARARRAGLLDQLRVHGFEPETGPDGVTVLRNCPFHRLARDHCELICTMNLHLLKGLLSEVDDTGLDARLVPAEGYCCVRLRPAGAADDQGG
jgi:predicted ArsR family transcriptional regulator